MDEVRFNSDQIGRYASCLNWGAVVLAVIFMATSWEGSGPHSAMGNGIRYMFVSVPVLLINVVSLIGLFVQPVLAGLYNQISGWGGQLLL